MQLSLSYIFHSLPLLSSCFLHTFLHIHTLTHTEAVCRSRTDKIVVATRKNLPHNLQAKFVPFAPARIRKVPYSRTIYILYLPSGKISHCHTKVNQYYISMIRKNSLINVWTLIHAKKQYIKKKN